MNNSDSDFEVTTKGVSNPNRCIAVTKTWTNTASLSPAYPLNNFNGEVGTEHVFSKEGGPFD